MPLKATEALVKSIYDHTHIYIYFSYYPISFKLMWINVHCVDNMHGFPQLLTSSISGIAWAMRTYLLVLGGSREWAELTLMTPASPPIAAAFWLCDKVTTAGCHLTHGLQHLCKAEALSIVWNGNELKSTSVKGLTLCYLGLHIKKDNQCFPS